MPYQEARRLNIGEGEVLQRPGSVVIHCRERKLAEEAVCNDEYNP